MVKNSVVTCLALALMVYLSSGAETFEYVGCFQDNPKDRMFPTVILIDQNSVYNCTKYCQDNFYVYAGLQNYRDCRCGNRLRDTASYPKLPEDKCNTPCPGNKAENCGNVSISSIYKTGLKAVLRKPDGTEVALVNDKFVVQ